MRQRTLPKRTLATRTLSEECRHAAQQESLRPSRTLGDSRHGCSRSRCAAYGALACVATRMQQSRCALAYGATRMRQNARREPEPLRGVRRSSVRRDADAAEPLRPSVRRDADAFRRMHAAGVAALKRTSATRMLSEECMHAAQQESLRSSVRRRRGCFPKTACTPRSRSRCAQAYVGDADAFRRVHACRAADV
jgi:hypothetical protein